MNVSSEVKKRAVNNVLDTVYAISDKQYQQRVWINGEGPEIDDFDETVNNYSLDAEGILEHPKDFWITETQFQILKKFDKLFSDFYKKNGWPPDFINKPEWRDIIEMAKEVLRAFNYKKTHRS